MTAFPQIKATAMRERVGQEIRQALTQKRFQPGQAIIEAGLAAEMGISRGPVREALLLLVQEGLVTHAPNRGFSVISFTEIDIRETNQVRLPLETLALTLAQGSVLEAELKQLDLLVDRISTTYQERDFTTCAQEDLAFHSLIWKASGNNRLSGALQLLLAPFFAYGALSSASRPNLTPGLLHEEHACFVRFLRNKELRNADECVRFHLGV